MANQAKWLLPRKAQAPVMEPLEARVLLSANPYSFADVDGDQVTVRLTGPGTMAITPDGAGLQQIILNNTDPVASALKIGVVKKGGGNGFVNVGRIRTTHDSEGLKSLDAPTTDITGYGGDGVSIMGYLGSVKVHSLAAAAHLCGQQTTSGGQLIFYPSTLKSTVTVLGSVGDGSSIIFSSQIVGLTIGGSMGTGYIQAPFLGTVKIGGDFTGKIDNVFGIGSITVGGQVSGAWDTNYRSGAVGSVKVGSSANTWTFDTHNAAIKSLTCNGQMDFTSITANSLETLTVKGGMNGGLTLKQTAGPLTLKTATVGGQVTGVWAISKAIGSITVGSSQVWNFQNADTAVGMLTCKGNLDVVALLALSIGTLDVKGDTQGGDIALYQPLDPKLLAAKTVKVGGYVRNSITTRGNVGSMTLGAILDGNILAGTKPGVGDLAVSTQASDYLTDTANRVKITSLTVTGKVAGYGIHNGDIIAGVLGKVVLNNVDTANAAPFGVAAVAIQSMTLKQPGDPALHTWGKNWLANPADEFTVKLLTV
ncbi:MAG: LEPR-XLL domain-containing protein [Planctomycetota bacterium]|nr:LEPR-XLL domain-containing protein [Planctomycetota bacterium]